MIQCAFIVCSLDGHEKENSQSYHDLLMLDPEAAEASLYTLLVPKDDDG